MPDVTYQTRDGGTMGAYVALPVNLPAPGIVIAQEIFGVNGFLRSKADELAAQGFVVVVPDLFWRIEPGVQLTDKSKEEWDKAFALMNAFNIDQGVEDLEDVTLAMREDTRTNGFIGCIGYCLGGKLAFLMATRTGVNASVSYYGVGLDALLDEAEYIEEPLMMHIAEEDKFVSKEAQSRIKAALQDDPLVTIHTYPGMDHAFTRTGGEHYDAAAAAIANERTVAFLKEALADPENAED